MMHVAPSAAAAAGRCAQHLAQSIEDAVRERGVAAIALSGGSTPRLMLPHLVDAHLSWPRVQVFQVDERGVPPGDPQSNATMLAEHLLGPAGVPEANFHRMRTELDAVVAAGRYEQELLAVLGPRPVFDVIVCGVGPDAHTASLFPGDPLIDDRTHLVAATFVEKSSQWRVTLLPRVLLATRGLLVLAAGADKAPAFTRIFDDRVPAPEAPARILFETSGSLHWYLDEACAPR